MSKRPKVRIPIERSVEDWLQDPEAWRQSFPPSKAEIYTARLSIDVTPELRTRIKLAAMKGNCVASNMLRELLERAFPEGSLDESTASPARARKSVKEST